MKLYMHELLYLLIFLKIYFRVKSIFEFVEIGGFIHLKVK